MKQIAVGPLTDAPASRAFADGLPRAGTALEGALSYTHDKFHAHRNYLEMLVRAPSTGVDRPAVHAAVRGAHYERVRALVGPVVGKVEAHSAVVLLEVDCEAPITCVATDTLRGSFVEQKRLLPARRPRVFLLEGLRAGTHYAVHFEGLSDGEIRRGSFRTPALDADADGEGPANYDARLLLVSGDVATRAALRSERTPGAERVEGERDAVTLTALVARATRRPWSVVDATVHLGAQVSRHLGRARARRGRS